MSLNTYNSNFLKVQEIGEPKISLTGKLNDNEIWLEGAEVSKTAYPLLYLIYGDTYGTAEDEDNFVLPDFRNRTVWGADDFGYLEAGLPNITGTFDSFSMSTATGAFTSSNLGQYNCYYNTNNYRKQITLDASNSNSIYGNSETVQPPAIKVRVKTRYKI